MHVSVAHHITQFLQYMVTTARDRIMCIYIYLVQECKIIIFFSDKLFKLYQMFPFILVEMQKVVIQSSSASIRGQSVSSLINNFTLNVPLTQSP